MKVAVRVFLVFVCFLGFAFIRFRESELFYDPLISFFKSNYQSTPLPDLYTGKLYLHLFLRYLFNTALSLLVLWLIFKERGIITFAILFYGIVFVILLLTLIVLLNTQDVGEYLPIFYVRRFIIQPILLFILLPAFYYYRKVSNS